MQHTILRITVYFRSSVRRRLLAWLGGMTLLMLLVTSAAVSYLVHQFEQELWRARRRGVTGADGRAAAATGGHRGRQEV